MAVTYLLLKLSSLFLYVLFNPVLGFLSETFFSNFNLLSVEIKKKEWNVNKIKVQTNEGTFLKTNQW